MQKHDFPTAHTFFNRYRELNRELLALVEHAEKHPQTSEQLDTYFTTCSTIVNASIDAAKLRTTSTGPGGGPVNTPEGEEGG